MGIRNGRRRVCRSKVAATRAARRRRDRLCGLVPNSANILEPAVETSRPIVMAAGHVYKLHRGEEMLLARRVTCVLHERATRRAAPGEM